jgi:hypothetical protein
MPREGKGTRYARSTCYSALSAVQFVLANCVLWLVRGRGLAQVSQVQRCWSDPEKQMYMS